ncbi:MAG: NADH-quinone oxidoreductase subunit NuoH [bacterium]
MPEIYAYLIEKSAVLIIMFVAVLMVVAWTTLAERKYAGFFQDRHGPNRAGPWGLLQPIADGVKFFMKEEFIPDRANKVLFVIAPTFTFMAGGFLMAVIPFGDRIVIFGREVVLQIADLNVGILYILAISSLSVYGIITGGWASNNKYSLMGGLRASSQMISYEIAMGLALVALILDHGSLSLRQIVLNQTGAIWHWSIFCHPIGFIIFMTAAFAESARIPFDLPEAENELVGGYHTEYSAMKYGLFMLGEYVHMTIASGLMATLYFGGWSIPWVTPPVNPTIWWGLLTMAVFWAKTFFFMFVFIWVRWTIPRFRYDQLMALGWKRLIPLGVFNIFFTAVLLTVFQALGVAK